MDLTNQPLLMMAGSKATYCGFPRSIRGLQTFMEVLDERKSKGIIDETGAGASPVNQDGSKYDRGKKILEELQKTPQSVTLKEEAKAVKNILGRIFS